jgi:hypothetical protein
MKSNALEWNAWYDASPGNSTKTLHVTSEIDVGSEGIDLELKFHTLKKSTPPSLVLVLIENIIYIPREKGETKVRVHYTQPAIPGEFKEIIILSFDGSEIKTIDGSEILIVH